MHIPLSRPDITSKEINAVLGVLKTPHLSLGPTQEKFQYQFAQFLGCRYAQAVSSGTAGLYLCLLAMDIGPGDEVITTPYSFVASSNVIWAVGAKPVFADIEPRTLNIDLNLIEKKITKRTKAILVVHVFGMPVDMVRVNKIAAKYKLKVIEDACEAIGAEINGVKAGNFSDAAVFAFYPNKQMTTGEGGMIVTNHKYISDACASMKNQGRGIGKQAKSFVRLGYNFRISDINCALGVVQLSRINSILKMRLNVANMYKKHLSEIEEITLLENKVEGRTRSWFVFVIQLGGKYTANKRDAVMNRLKSQGVECGRYFPAIHLQPFYRKAFSYKKGSFPVCEHVADRSFALPFHNNLQESQVKFVKKALTKVL